MSEEDPRKSIIMRLRRIEGQVRGVQRMIEEGSDCGEVLNQVAAIRSAVNQVGLLVLKTMPRIVCGRQARMVQMKQTLRKS